MTGADWLGRRWDDVRRDLEQSKSRYETVTTCAPNRLPHGDDVRVVQVRRAEDKFLITLCAFNTDVNRT